MNDNDPFDPKSAAHVALRREAKTALRARAQALRRAIPAAQRAARSARFGTQLDAVAEWRAAKVIAAYAPLPSEADPSSALTDAVTRGAHIVLPRVRAHDGSLSFASAEGPLLRSSAGIREPPPDRDEMPPELMDVVLVPLLAVDERGHRLGYGKGYYDRFLPRATNATFIGLAFDFQLFAELPDTAGDVPLDVVVTDRRVLRPGAPSLA